MEINVDIMPILKKIDRIIEDAKQEELRPLLHYCFEISYLIGCKDILSSMPSSITQHHKNQNSTATCCTIQGKIDEIEDLLNSFCKDGSKP